MNWLFEQEMEKNDKIEVHDRQLASEYGGEKRGGGKRGKKKKRNARGTRKRKRKEGKKKGEEGGEGEEGEKKKRGHAEAYDKPLAIMVGKKGEREKRGNIEVHDDKAASERYYRE